MPQSATELLRRDACTQHVRQFDYEQCSDVGIYPPPPDVFLDHAAICRVQSLNQCAQGGE